MITRREVDTAFVQFLRDNLDPEIYWGHVPADATLPYVVVYGIAGGDLHGPPLTAPEADAETIYQTTCVGGTPSQAVWMDDKVRHLVAGRTATGDFTTALTVTGATVMDRYIVDGIAAAEPTGGLWQCTPRYCIHISS